jgi:hypothetical protein
MGPRGYGYYSPNGVWLGAAAAALIVGGAAAAAASSRRDVYEECWTERRYVERPDGLVVRRNIRVCE